MVHPGAGTPATEPEKVVVNAAVWDLAAVHLPDRDLPRRRLPKNVIVAVAAEIAGRIDDIPTRRRNTDSRAIHRGKGRGRDLGLVYPQTGTTPVLVLNTRLAKTVGAAVTAVVAASELSDEELFVVASNTPTSNVSTPGSGPPTYWTLPRLFAATKIG